MNSARVLPALRIAGDFILASPAVPAGPVKLDDLALNVMTDFRQVTPITVAGETSIDEALQHMIHSGVRLLFAIDRDSRLIGLITSNDILGEKPIRHMQSIGCVDKTCSRRDVLVTDIMIPVAAWDVLDYEAARRATVAQVVATFEAVGRRHLVVVERAVPLGLWMVRGIFSASRLEQQLGLTLDLVCTAKSFAEVENVLAHPRADCD